MTSASCPSPPLSRVNDCTLPVDLCGQRFPHEEDHPVWPHTAQTGHCSPAGDGAPCGRLGRENLVATPGGGRWSVRPLGLGDGRDGGERYLHVHSPQHNSWHPRAPPQPGMPAQIPTRVVSPGPLPHVRWQSIPNCLHSSAVKTATLGPGLAGTPPSGSVHAGEDVQGLTCGHLPLCARMWVGIHGHGCALGAHGCMDVSVGADMHGGGHTHLCGHSCTHEGCRGGVCAGGNLRIPWGPPGWWAANCAHAQCQRWCVFPIPEGPCMCEGHAARYGLSQAECAATGDSWRKQEKEVRMRSGVENPSAWLSHVSPTHSPR